VRDPGPLGLEHGEFVAPEFQHDVARQTLAAPAARLDATGADLFALDAGPAGAPASRDQHRVDAVGAGVGFGFGLGHGRSR